MESMLLRIFQRQIALQCKFIIRSEIEISVALRERNSEKVFYSLQNLLNSSANISKAFWGQGESKSQQRRKLRESVGISDNSPLKKVVDMRNNFEHFDERIDRWWSESKNKIYIDLNIASNGSIIVDESITKDTFRNYDPETTNLTFWSDVFNIRAIVTEAKVILPKLEEVLNKPNS